MKPHDIDELQNAIEEEIRAAPDNMVREAMRTLHDRLEQCRRDGGKHLISKICNNSDVVYLNRILFPIVLYKK